MPEGARAVCTVLLDSLAVLDRQITVLDREIARRAREDEAARRLMTIPGVGPITVTAGGARPHISSTVAPAAGSKPRAALLI